MTIFGLHPSRQNIFIATRSRSALRQNHECKPACVREMNASGATSIGAHSRAFWIVHVLSLSSLVKRAMVGIDLGLHAPGSNPRLSRLRRPDAPSTIRRSAFHARIPAAATARISCRCRRDDTDPISCSHILDVFRLSGRFCLNVAAEPARSTALMRRRGDAGASARTCTSARRRT